MWEWRVEKQLVSYGKKSEKGKIGPTRRAKEEK
jgi:hypothetical protein